MLAEFGPNRPEADKHRPMLAEVCQMLAQVGQIRPNRGPSWPQLTKPGRAWAFVRRNLPNSADGSRSDCSTTVGRLFGKFGTTAKLAGIARRNASGCVASNLSVGVRRPTLRDWTVNGPPRGLDLNLRLSGRRRLDLVKISAGTRRCKFWPENMSVRHVASAKVGHCFRKVSEIRRVLPKIGRTRPRM